MLASHFISCRERTSNPGFPDISRFAIRNHFSWKEAVVGNSTSVFPVCENERRVTHRPRSGFSLEAELHLRDP